MADIKELAKKYWPFIVGGGVGLYLLTRGSSPSVPTGTVSYTAPSSGSSGVSQSELLQAQLGMEREKLNAQTSLANRGYDIQELAINLEGTKAANEYQLGRDTAQGNAFLNFQLTQAAMADSLGNLAGKTIDALNTPAVMAINSAAAENAAAYTAAGNTAAAAFNAQANIVSTSSASTGILGSSMFNNQTNIPSRATSFMDVLKTAVYSNSPAGYSGGGSGLTVNTGGTRQQAANDSGSGNYASAQNTTNQSDPMGDFMKFGSMFMGGGGGFGFA